MLSNTLLPIFLKPLRLLQPWNLFLLPYGNCIVFLVDIFFNCRNCGNLGEHEEGEELQSATPVRWRCFCCSASHASLVRISSEYHIAVIIMLDLRKLWWIINNCLIFNLEY